MQFSIPIVNKARKPKFEAHLKIYDLNNVPLVSGVSLIKWNLPHSLHGDHRGRTPKCPIANHRVEYNYSKVIPVRIGIDRNSNLSECPIEFEILQEFSVAGPSGGVGGREEKITLGTVRLNLSEYVEESEAILREGVNAAPIGRTSFNASTGTEKGHSRKRSSLSLLGFDANAEDLSPRSSRHGDVDERPVTAGSMDVEEGVVRRHLMQDSKINSTLKIGILMVQIDGDRNYVAPALKTAPVFGGIAGIMAGEPLGDPAGQPAIDSLGGALPASLTSKARDKTAELQDMYRRSLAASWACQPGELAADECIEDIFAGGDGFKTGDHHKQSDGLSHSSSRNYGRSHRHLDANGASSGSTSAGDPHSAGPREDSGSGSGEEEDMVGTLRPRDMARLRARLRNHSSNSDRSTATVRDHASESSRGIGLGASGGRMDSHRDYAFLHAPHQQRHGRGDSGKESEHLSGGGLRSRSDSLGSLTTTTTVGTDRHDRGREGFRRIKELEEDEAREDLVAWTVRSPAAATVV